MSSLQVRGWAPTTVAGDMQKCLVRLSGRAMQSLNIFLYATLEKFCSAILRSVMQVAHVRTASRCGARSCLPAL